MSLPGLVSQRQCKVTARRTRASRCCPLCNGPQPPFPRALCTTPAPHFSLSVSIFSHSFQCMSIGFAAKSCRAIFFLCSPALTPVTRCVHCNVSFPKIVFRLLSFCKLRRVGFPDSPENTIFANKSTQRFHFWILLKSNTHNELSQILGCLSGRHCRHLCILGVFDGNRSNARIAAFSFRPRPVLF